jgi:integrase
MARIPKIKVQNTEKGWLVNIPATYSETGARARRYFKTRELASEFATTLRDNVKDHGAKSVTLSAQITMDALKAVAIMGKFSGFTLTQAAQFFAKHHDQAAKCPTMKQAFDEAMNRRGNLSIAYQRDMRGLRKRLPVEFMAMNIYEITGKDISAALDSCNGGLTQWRNAFRTLRAILSDQVKSGTIKTNPCANVHTPRVKRNAEVVIYTAKQVQAIFDACKDYQDGEKRACTDCAVPFAVLFYAGVRPVEFTRLTWENINLETGFIRLSGDITKTGKTRNIPITDTLRAWLETVPADQRDGKIMPTDWRDKSQRVKKEAGICGRKYQDAARHTYGSFTVALEGIDYVRATMGHGHTATFETHYHNALTIPQAREYMEILPQISIEQKGAMTA